jgi:hypothetical protein
MKSIALAIMVFISSEIGAQLITVKLDTCQFFEHSALMSTPQAIESGLLVYKKRYTNKPNFQVTFNIEKRIETYHNYDFDIIEINPSSNILDIVVKERDLTSLVVLGETEEGNIMYIYEYREGDLMKGFFSVNPEITRHESTSPSDVSN